MSDFRLSVVIPVYNEAENLPSLLPKLLPLCREKNWQIVFVDDGSTDDSLSLLQEVESPPTVKVIRHKVNKGYGRALKSGIMEADAPFLVTFDSDGQHQIEDIQRMYDLALKEDMDLVVGKRIQDSAPDYYRQVGKWLIRTFSGFLVPLPISDLNSGFKFYRAALAKRYLRVCPDTMAFSDVMTLVFIIRKDKVAEMPIKVLPREKGESVINFYTAVDTVLEILNIVMLFNPMKIFGLLSLFSLIAGILWGLPFLLMGRGLTIAALLLLMLGALFFSIGLIASQLSAIRLDSVDMDFRRG